MRSVMKFLRSLAADISQQYEKLGSDSWREQCDHILSWSGNDYVDESSSEGGLFISCHGRMYQSSAFIVFVCDSVLVNV